MSRGSFPCLSVLAALSACQATPVVQQHRAKAMVEPQPAVTTAGNRVIFSSPQALPSGPTSTRRMVRSLLHVPERMQFGEFVWNDQGVPPGQTWIRVDLASQLISVFRGQEEIGTAVIVYGTDRKATPTGEFPVLAKMRKHRSSLYDAAMPFTLRLTDDGISIHASDVRWGAATHGCIGVPEKFAEKMFDAVSTGSPVIIVDKQVA